ncbi:hypothetical protein WMY93_009079 [Mugilogobius chulae]|uniref:Ig-like domain-containing protein n=1 Tax=Mugilogobius chulae TaxID=88201 RepID=A0AAW0PLM5_9GOBI
MTVLSAGVSGPVDSGDSVDLQCWVQTQNTQCFEEHMVWWFRSGLDQSGPALVYTQRNSSGQCDRSTEGPAPHKCLYTFSKSMSPSDAGTYHCAVAACGLMLFGNGNTVTVTDPDMVVLSPGVSGPVDSGDSVDLQCWVQTQNTQCFEEHMVWWFRSGLNQSGPALVYTQRNSSGQCDRSTEGPAPHKCLYTFSKSMSPSDARTYHCAVAACGLMLFGNGNTVTDKDAIILLSVALTISIMIILVLIYCIKKKNGFCFQEDKTTLMKESVMNMQDKNCGMTYSAPKYKKSKADRPQGRALNTEEHVLYSDVRVRQ